MPAENGAHKRSAKRRATIVVSVATAGAVVGTDFYVRFVGKSDTNWKVSTGSPVWDAPRDLSRRQAERVPVSHCRTDARHAFRPTHSWISIFQLDYQLNRML